MEVDRTEKAEDPDEDLDDGVVVNPDPEPDATESDEVVRCVGRVGGVSGIAKLDMAASIDDSGRAVSSKR